MTHYKTVKETSIINWRQILFFVVILLLACSGTWLGLRTHSNNQDTPTANLAPAEPALPVGHIEEEPLPEPEDAKALSVSVPGESEPEMEYIDPGIIYVGNAETLPEDLPAHLKITQANPNPAPSKGTNPTSAQSTPVKTEEIQAFLHTLEIQGIGPKGAILNGRHILWGQAIDSDGQIVLASADNGQLVFSVQGTTFKRKF